MEDSSLKTGFMAVFAVSGSVVFLAMQAHKRLLSNFMKKMEFEIKNSTGGVKDEPKKKVRFADEVAESTASKGYLKKNSRSPAVVSGGRNDDRESLEALPQNWQAMYKGILQCKNIRGYY